MSIITQIVFSAGASQDVEYSDPMQSSGFDKTRKLKVAGSG